MNPNQPTDPKVQTTMFNFMSPTPPQPAASSAGMPNLAGFKTPTTTTNQNKPATGFILTPTTPASTTAVPSLGMPIMSTPTSSKPATTTASAPGFSFSAPKTTATSTSQPASAPTTAALVLTAPATTASTTQPLGGTTSSLTGTTPSLTGITPSLGGTLGLGAKAPAAPSAPQTQTLTFQQLEELILNKWTSELYEQEKMFLNQATQINIWDKVINDNAEKLTQLHTTMEKVRKQQTKINDDLEVIANHQKDLEACLVPLEKEDLLSVLKGDPNRKNLYSNAKKIDSQIKSMSENLKETIEHINETSRSHDTEDPVIQIGRILNAHMESLRWIDEHTARMQDYFDSLLKMHDDLRRECDLNKH